MTRRYYSGRDIGKTICIEELRQLARRRIPEFALEFLEGGAEDEHTLDWNREIFRSKRFIPRTLVDTSLRHTRIRLFDQDAPSPLIIAPTGHNGILWNGGDIALARAAASRGIPFTLSTLSNTKIEVLPEKSNGRLWFQLYYFGDPKLTDDLIEKADRSGYEALVFTTDANVYGLREWDRRHFRAPAQLTIRSTLEALQHPRWMLDIMIRGGGIPRLENVIDFFPPDARDTRAAVTQVPKLFVPTITWEHLAELRRRWPRKLIAKGILSVEDALRAADIGCDAIVISNHGARHLDSSVSSLEVLPAISAAVGNRLTIIVDGGFRRGSDIVKAIALGADAVMVGRATLYGLAAGGEGGVAHALDLLNEEIHRVLGQIGRVCLDDLDPQCIQDS
jgi:(S)-mandelate dehydrogenase